MRRARTANPVVEALRHGLPVFRKELIETAARRRTYVIRCVYAVLLFTGFLFLYDAVSGQSDAIYDRGTTIGAGEQLFDRVAQLQFIGVYLFVPAMTIASIVREKEQGSLALILLTRVTPMEIVQEKLLGGIFPMLSLFFVSLPLMALAYALGGVSTERVWHVAWLFLVSCIQVGAVSVLFGAYSSSFARGLVLTYSVGALLVIFMPILIFSIGAIPLALLAEAVGAEPEFGILGGLAPSAYEFAKRSSAAGPSLLFSGGLNLVSAWLVLVVARGFLINRPFLRPGNLLLERFRHLDEFFEQYGPVVVPDRASEPREGEPVRWRELHQKAYSRLRYLVRIALVVELPVVFVAASIGSSMSSNWGYAGARWVGLVHAVWTLGAIAIAAVAVGSISSERASGTLEVLRTTPLGAGEVVRQKHAGQRRVRLLLWVPLWTVYGIWLFYIRPRGFELWSSLAFMVGSMIVFTEIISWLAFFVALHVKSRVNALTVTIVVLVLWNYVPSIVLDVIAAQPHGYGIARSLASGMRYVCPWHMLVWHLWGEADGSVLIGLAGLGVLAFALRRTCIRRAERWLEKSA